MDEQVRRAGNPDAAVRLGGQGGASSSWSLAGKNVAGRGDTIHGCDPRELEHRNRRQAMSRTLSLVTVLSLILSACLPPFLQPEVAVQAPGSESDLQATAALLAQQTLDALPSSTSAPSQTPVVKTATDTMNPSLTPGLGTRTVTQAATLPSTTPTPTGSVPEIGRASCRERV